MPSFSDMDTFGYKILQMPIESLIISYPHNKLKAVIEQIPEPNYTNVLDENTISSPVNDEVLEQEDGDEGEIKGGVLLIGGEGTEDEEDSSSSNVGTYDLNPKELTGKIGMERMMNFVDSRETFVKGNYEYKDTTITEYGRIFSSDIIGKYSSKIKNIIDLILK
jgi:hypothetical protein